MQRAHHLLGQRVGNAQSVRDLACLEFLQTGSGFHGRADDRLGLLLGNLFDLHATFRRGNDHDALGGAVQHETQIDFAGEVDRRFNVDAVDALAFGAGLMRHQFAAEHVVRRILNFMLGVAQLDAARLATATCVDLGLDDPAAAAKFASPVGRLFGAVGQPAGWYRDAEFRQNLFGLVFVNVHFSLPQADVTRLPFLLGNAGSAPPAPRQHLPPRPSRSSQRRNARRCR